MRPDEVIDRFAWGVASGDPATDGAVLWTRVPEGSEAVSWEVWTDGSGPDTPLATGVTHANDHGHVHVVVEGLDPGAVFAYRFRSGGATSPTGRFRTLPDHPTTARLAVACCAKRNSGWFNVYDRIAERDDLDLVIHLGDYIYEAANQPPASQTPGRRLGRDFVPDDECRDFASYDQRYAQYRTDPAVQELHRRHAVVATLDDHELADNAWSGGAQEHRDAEHGIWSERSAAALAAWQDWMPTTRVPGGESGIETEITLGELVQVLVLECRTRRTDPQTDPDLRTQLGPAQLAWLLDRIRRGTARWLVICSPGLFTTLWHPHLSEDATWALRKLKLVGLESDEPWADGWDAYAHERDAILGAVRESGRRCQVVSGDAHISVDATLHDDDGRVLAHEACTPSVTSQNLDDKAGWAPRTESLRYEAAVCAEVDSVDWCDFDSHAYLEVTADETSLTVSWLAVDTILTPSVGVDAVRVTTRTVDDWYDRPAGDRVRGA
jgi:alkaline phosphatase D